ncbi:atherin-like [Oryza brachyantha]|uniref:atherin-like n=1 Tax=Oryza brachyantha TaxID=4533 RepID=UPI001ADCDD98|nr:atherin-like [Oryza brachyantha]
MSSPPPQRPPATAAPPATSPPAPAAASQPLPRAFLAAAAASSPRRAAASPTQPPPPPPPPLFTGRPLNPNPSHASPAHGILYPVTTSSAAAAAAAATGNHRRAPAVAVGFPRAHAVAVPIVQPQHHMAPAQGRSFPAAPRAVVAGVSSRPEHPPRGVPIAPQAQPKANPIPIVTPSLQEISSSKDSERSKEDVTTVVINDRKVNLVDSESGSLYALCRSWVRNGVPHESQFLQPSFGTGAPILPRPLPASVVDSRISEKDSDAEKEDSEEEKNETVEYTVSALLKQHVKRAKMIRAGLQKERLRRIERYKQRLALLLPPPSELGKHDGHPYQ